MKGCMRWVVLFSTLVCTTVLASEKSVYDFSWLDKDKEIYVLQNRKYRKDGRLYVGLTGVKTLSGAFVDSMGGHFRAGYFFNEDWGFEFTYGKYSSSRNDTNKGVREQGTIPYARKIDNVMGALLWWSPFYAKINTFNEIFYFDWMFGAGAAKIGTLDNRKEFNVVKSTTETAEDTTALMWSTAMRFHLSQAWSFRLDFTGLHYNANRTSRSSVGATPFTKKQLFSNYDIGLGLVFAF